MMPVPHGIYSSCTCLAVIFFPFVYILNFYFPLSYFLPLYLFPLFLSLFPSFFYSSFLKIFPSSGMFGGRRYIKICTPAVHSPKLPWRFLHSLFSLSYHCARVLSYFLSGERKRPGVRWLLNCLSACVQPGHKTCFWTLSEIHSVHRVFIRWGSRVWHTKALNS